MNRKIVVPEDMLAAALGRFGITPTWRQREETEFLLLAALEWLSENPLYPTEDKLLAIADKVPSGVTPNFLRGLLLSWQRVMFLAPKPPLSRLVSEAIEVLKGTSITQSDWEYIQETIGRLVVPNAANQKESMIHRSTRNPSANTSHTS